jgi:hypothetical protein
MNRPFYALATLVASLTGAAVAIGPAKCQLEPTSQIQNSVRVYCALPVGSYAVLTHVFAHTKVTDSVSNAENFNYESSCGRDSLTGDIYSAPSLGNDGYYHECDYDAVVPTATPTDDTEASFFTDEQHADSESWPVSERIESNDTQEAYHYDHGQQHCPYSGAYDQVFTELGNSENNLSEYSVKLVELENTIAWTAAQLTEWQQTWNSLNMWHPLIGDNYVVAEESMSEIMNDYAHAELAAARQDMANAPSPELAYAPEATSVPYAIEYRAHYDVPADTHEWNTPFPNNSTPQRNSETIYQQWPALPENWKTLHPLNKQQEAQLLQTWQTVSQSWPLQSLSTIAVELKQIHANQAFENYVSLVEFDDLILGNRAKVESKSGAAWEIQSQLAEGLHAIGNWIHSLANTLKRPETLSSAGVKSRR